MGAPRSETTGGYLRHPEDVAVFTVDKKKGVWECDRRFCQSPNGVGPLYGPPGAWIRAWWNHLREEHDTEEQEMT